MKGPCPCDPLGEPSAVPSCEEKGSSEASCEGSCETSDEPFIHMKVHVTVHLEAHLEVNLEVHLEVKNIQFYHFEFSSQSVRPPRACYQSVVNPIEDVVRFSCGPKAYHRNSVCQSVVLSARSSKQRAPIGSAMRLGHRNSVRQSVVR